MKGWEDEVKCNFAALLISTGCRRGEGRELLNLKSCIPRLAVDSYIKLRGEGGRKPHFITLILCLILTEFRHCTLLGSFYVKYEITRHYSYRHGELKNIHRDLS